MSVTDLPLVDIEWNLFILFHAYVIAVQGIYCGIQLMERRRTTKIEEKGRRRWLLMSSSLASGGCGLWGTHFLGTLSITLKNPAVPGQNINIDYNGYRIMVSFLLAVFPMALGLWISSKDKFFVELELNHNSLSNTIISHKKWRMISKCLGTRIDVLNKVAILFAAPQRIIIGGMIAGVGVLGTHTAGAWSQLVPCEIYWLPIDVFKVALIAVASAIFGFWILFRVLSIWPNSELLRFASACLMGAVVSGTQYAGKRSVTYYYDPSANYNSSFFISGDLMGEMSTEGTCLLCYGLISIFIIIANRDIVAAVNTMKNSTTKRNSNKSSTEPAKIEGLVEKSMGVKIPKEDTLKETPKKRVGNNLVDSKPKFVVFQLPASPLPPSPFMQVVPSETTVTQTL